MSLLARFLVGVLAVAGLTLAGAPVASASTLQSGFVRTGDGSPLGGATVAVFDETGKGIAGSTTTAPDGSYTLDDCAHCQGQVVASAAGYTSARGGPDYTLFAAPKPYVGWASTSVLTFGWNAVPGAVAYQLVIADERTFKHPKIIFRATKTAHTYKQLLPQHLYYLHVYPIDAGSHVIKPDGWLGDNTRPVAGRTGYVNNLRVYGSTSTSLTFAWAPLLFSTCCAQYEVQLSRTMSFAAHRTKFSLHGDDVLTFTNLAPGTVYYARVRARNPSHTYLSAWSGTRVANTP